MEYLSECAALDLPKGIQIKVFMERELSFIRNIRALCNLRKIPRFKKGARLELLYLKTVYPYHVALRNLRVKGFINIYTDKKKRKNVRYPKQLKKEILFYKLENPSYEKHKKEEISRLSST